MLPPQFFLPSGGSGQNFPPPSPLAGGQFAERPIFLTTNLSAAVTAVVKQALLLYDMW